MNELAYLGLAIVISAVGSFFIWFRNGRPQSLESGVQQFTKGLEALESNALGQSLVGKSKGRRSA